MLKPIHFVPRNTTIPFMAYRSWGYVFSILITLVSLAAVPIFGLNFGIDFRGGILIEVRATGGPADIQSMRQTLGALELGEVGLQEFGRPEDVLINVQQQEGGERAQQAALEKIRAALGQGYEYRRVEFIGPKVGAELIRDGALAIGLALLGILVYVWFRFDWQFGMAAIVTLLHDVIATIGLFAVFQMEFNLSTVAAVLTIAGYSVNDTVVVYDRIRENLRKYKKMDLTALCDLSLNETLSRTVLTGGTTVLALIALAAFGGPVIAGFTLAMIFGIVVGTYSSIFISTPLVLFTDLRKARGVTGETDPVDDRP